MKSLNPKITCKDGTTISVQASEYHYCTPRTDEGPYTHVEVGFPSVEPHAKMMEYAKKDDIPTETVYGWVPVEVVQEFIDLHGGISKGEMPS